jgi:hypothetical protein
MGEKLVPMLMSTSESAGGYLFETRTENTSVPGKKEYFPALALELHSPKLRVQRQLLQLVIACEPSCDRLNVPGEKIKKKQNENDDKKDHQTSKKQRTVPVDALVMNSKK